MVEKVGEVTSDLETIAPMPYLCCPSFYGTSLIGLKGVGASPRSGAYSPLAFTQEHQAQGNPHIGGNIFERPIKYKDD